MTSEEDNQTTTSESQNDKETRKDPEEEYFKLAVLAIKTKKHYEDPDNIIEVCSWKLFKKARRD